MDANIGLFIEESLLKVDDRELASPLQHIFWVVAGRPNSQRSSYDNAEVRFLHVLLCHGPVRLEKIFGKIYNGVH